ncbi:glycine betaine/L-proline ABC transporter substrate-binding protein ProX [Breoghania sp.]|uniref:glycine betaine/L-proline ABC transporter substrate-binding protein ProX n=1 Tax=Breoghania sp. TaxID=2065378 RepID=UPI0029C9E840|nr:glycine betaine/L-proline ABC transporter substrate-binding protein ProX [Breoghania sp.]
MRHLMRSLTAVAVIAAGLSPMAAMAEEPGDGVTVKMSQATWDTGWFHAEIYSQLLQKLGYDVKGPTTLDAPAFYQSVAQGDMDLWVNGWFPLHETYKDTIDQGAEIVGAVAKGGALQGYLVDKKAIDEFGIKSLEDFKRDDVKKAFDRNGDGKADLVACPPGWGCEVRISETLDTLKLTDDINQIKAGYSASMADAIAAYQAGEHVLFYTWTPNWTVNELSPGKDVMWIEATTDDSIKMPEPAVGLETCVADPCTMGFQANDIVPVANSAFLKANPAAKKLLEEVKIPLADIYAQNSAMNNGDDDVKAQAAAWIEANKAAVDGWLEAARAAAK